MSKQQFQADGLWLHFSLLLFNRSKLDPTAKGPTNQMSLSVGLSSQTHWRRFVMHSLAKPFHCFHVHIKNMVTDQMVTDRMTNTNEFIWWLIKPNSLKKVRDAFSYRIFPLFSCSYKKHGDRLNQRSKEFSWWLVKSNSLKKVRDTSFCKIFPKWKQDKDWQRVHDGRQSSNWDLAKVISTSLIPSSPTE